MPAASRLAGRGSRFGLRGAATAECAWARAAHHRMQPPRHQRDRGPLRGGIRLRDRRPGLRGRERRIRAREMQPLGPRLTEHARQRHEPRDLFPLHPRPARVGQALERRAPLFDGAPRARKVEPLLPHHHQLALPRQLGRQRQHRRHRRVVQGRHVQHRELVARPLHARSSPARARSGCRPPAPARRAALVSPSASSGGIQRDTGALLPCRPARLLDARELPRSTRHRTPTQPAPGLARPSASRPRPSARRTARATARPGGSAASSSAQ